MPILKYTLVKYYKSSSTWAVSIFAFLVIIIFCGVIGFNNLHQKNITLNQYQNDSSELIKTSGIFLIILVGLFCAFKSASLYRSEISNGTISIILAKPISRQKIIYQMWSALIISSILFTFYLYLIFTITLIIFDNQNNVPSNLREKLAPFCLRTNAWKIGGIIWGVILVFSFLFNGLGLLIATFCSRATTIGFVLGLSLLIPTTAMVRILSEKKSYDNINSPIASNIINNHFEALAPYLSIDKKTLFKNLHGTPTKPTLFNVGLNLETNNQFKYLWTTALNFQANSVVNLSNQFLADSQTKNDLSFVRAMGNWHYTQDLDAIDPNLNLDGLNLLDAMIANSWAAIEPLQIATFKFIQETFDTEDHFSLKINNDFQKSLADVGIKINNQIFTNNDLKLLLNLKYDETLVSQQQKANYVKLYHDFIRFYNQNVTSFPLANLKIEKISHNQNIIHDLGNILDPFYLIDYWILEKSVQNLNIEIKSDYYPEKSNNSPGLIIINNDDNIDNSYQILASAINNGYELQKIKVVKYVQESTLIIAYITISLALAITSLIVLLRKNF